MQIRGATLLFVDDRYEMVQMQAQRLRQKGASVIHKTRLMDALEFLSSELVHAAVIDLHMNLPEAPWPAQFRPSIEAVTGHASTNVREHNGGQIVGHYINTSLAGRVPFIYLSAVAPFFEPIENAAPIGELKCFSRFEMTLDLLEETLRNMPRVRRPGS